MAIIANVPENWAVVTTDTVEVVTVETIISPLQEDLLPLYLRLSASQYLSPLNMDKQTCAL